MTIDDGMGDGARARRQEQSERAPGSASSSRIDRAVAPLDDATCWVCGAPAVYRKCKIICTVCGFMRDCSDP